MMPRRQPTDTKKAPGRTSTTGTHSSRERRQNSGAREVPGQTPPAPAATSPVQTTVASSGASTASTELPIQITEPSDGGSASSPTTTVLQESSDLISDHQARMMDELRLLADTQGEMIVKMMTSDHQGFRELLEGLPKKIKILLRIGEEETAAASAAQGRRQEETAAASAAQGRRQEDVVGVSGVPQKVPAKVVASPELMAKINARRDAERKQKDLIAEQTRNIASTEQQLKEVSGTLQDLQQKYKQQQEEMTGQQSQIERLSDKIRTLESEKQALQHSLETQAQELSGNRDEYERNISELQKTIASTEQQLKKAKSELQALQQKDKHQQEEMAEQQSQIERLSDKIRTLESEKQALQHSLETQAQELSGNRDEYERNISELQKTIASTEQQLKEVSGTLQDLQQKYKQQQSQIERLSDKIRTLESEKQALQHSLEAQAQEFSRNKAEHERKINILEQELKESLDFRIQDMTSYRQRLKMLFSELNKREEIIGRTTAENEILRKWLAVSPGNTPEKVSRSLPMSYRESPPSSPTTERLRAPGEDSGLADAQLDAVRQRF